MEWQCTSCGNQATTKTNKLPRNWHRPGQALLCKTCFRSHYCTRAAELPVAGPVDGEWSQLEELLDAQFDLSTQLHNWCALRLLQQDRFRRPGMVKTSELGPAPAIVHSEASRLFDTMSSATIAGAIRKVQKTYGEFRFERNWRFERGAETFKYPQPIIVRDGQWSLEFVNGQPVVHARLGDHRWALRLRAGKGFHRQLALLRAIQAGEAIPATLEFMRRRGGAGDHRHISEDRAPGGGNRRQWRLMAKVVGHFPRSEKAAGNGTMVVRTCSRSFLVARFPGGSRNAWWRHGDEMRRWLVGHNAQMQRLREDFKSERRRERGGMAERMARICEKNDRRKKTFIDQAVAELIGVARRRRVQTIALDDSQRDFLGSFPYESLREKLADRLPAGMTLLYVPELRADQKRLKKEFQYDQKLAELDAALIAIRSEEDGSTNDHDDGNADHSGQAVAENVR